MATVERANDLGRMAGLGTGPPQVRFQLVSQLVMVLRSFFSRHGLDRGAQQLLIAMTPGLDEAD